MTWTPLLKNQVINKRSMKEHNYRGKAGRAIRFAPRTLGQVSRYSLPCSKKGNGENYYFFTRLCPGRDRERESNKQVCEYVCMRTLWSPLPFIRVFRCFFLQSLHFFVSSFDKNRKRSSFMFPIPEVFYFKLLTPPSAFFFCFCDPYDFKNLFFLPSQVMRAFERGAVAQQFCKLIARNAWDVSV